MLQTRIMTALLLAGSLLAGLFYLPLSAMQGVFAGIVMIAAWEWAGLLKANGSLRLIYACFTGLICLLLWLGNLPDALLQVLWVGSAAFWLLMVPFWLRFKWSLRADFMGACVGWVLLIPSWAAMVFLHQRGVGWLLAAMALVWVADIAAYFFGRLLGRHKLAPTVSPGKTWEGAAGAVIGVLIYVVVIAYTTGLFAQASYRQLMLVALLVVVLTAISIVGDLFESLVKRQAGVKDSSHLLPGHGGVLDRIDSLTSTLPFAALVVFAMPAQGF
jgi:phosphatidate cytidylyltransferase